MIFLCGLLSRTNSSLIICIFSLLCSTIVAYEPIIRKLSNHLLSLELTTKLLSQQSTNPVQLERLSKLLETARVEINAKKKCMLEGEFFERCHFFDSFWLLVVKVFDQHFKKDNSTSYSDFDICQMPNVI